MSASELAKLAAMFPRTEIIRTYGQSETFRTLLNRNRDDATPGKPIVGTTAFLIDEEGHVCAPGNAGELIHQGEGSMIGYFDNMVKRFDTRLRLGEIEEALAKHPEIERVAIVSKSASNKTDVRQTLICAYVVARKDSERSEESLLTFCSQILSPLKVVDAVKFLAAIPTTASYKIDRQLLKSMWTERETL